MKTVRAVLLLGLLLTPCAGSATEAIPFQSEERAPYANTWLVIGLFENTVGQEGFERDWIGEAHIAPEAGESVAGKKWTFFDDRLFSRNMDDYQDFFSYWWVKQGKSIAGKVTYAHVYAYAPQAQEGQLRVGGDTACAAWLNGARLIQDNQGGSVKDAFVAPAWIEAGWNRILVKVATTEKGRFGFYARLTTPQGKKIPGLFYSPAGPSGALRITTRPIDAFQTPALPTAWREWAYVGASFEDAAGWKAMTADMLCAPALALDASDYYLTAGGGIPPYSWRLAQGELPVGLRLHADGRLTGAVSSGTPLIEYPVRVEVRDAAGAVTQGEMSIRVNERPNKWYEEARLGALIHRPESLRVKEVDRFAAVMKRQGYGLGFVISYNNGKHQYRWPSLYEPQNELGDVIGPYKSALEKAGVPFGMYIGNLNGPNHNGDNGALLLVEDAILKYQPKAFWFDWAGWNGVSLDALYSMIKSYDAEIIVVLNGMPTLSNGDWDVVCLEGWGSWGENMWRHWPIDFWWPKRNAIESWRLVSDPAFEYSRDVRPDWREYLRVQIALIGEGRIANIDHSPTIESGVGEDKKLRNLDASIVFKAHEAMAAWANPEGRPPLYTAYTGVNPAPLPPAEWGYSLLSVDRRRLYLHAVKTPMGKTGGFPEEELRLEQVMAPVDSVICMNSGEVLDHQQEDATVSISMLNVLSDPVDTILALELARPWPESSAQGLAFRPPLPVPPGNLATGKPARLMSNQGDYALIPSAMQFARYGVDGDKKTTACGANEWAWSYEVDLLESHLLSRVVIHFGAGYPTHYELWVAENQEKWEKVDSRLEQRGAAQEHLVSSRSVRYLRIKALKPDGPNQPGTQMQVAELEVYGASGE